MAFGVTAGLSAHQKDAFEELKMRTSDSFGKDAVDDSRLYRFLKAREYDVKEAEIMLRNHMKWRKDDKIDMILENYNPSEVLKKYFPMNVIGFDKEGSPALHFDFGNCDFRGYTKSATRKAILKHLAYFLELAEHQAGNPTKKINSPVESWTFIIDCENFSLAQATHKASIDALLACVSCYEANYPERLKVAYVIKAPIYFQYVFNILKKVMARATIQKVKILGKDNWQEVLLNAVDSEVLPAYLGGMKTDPDGNPRCVTTMVHGGLIPQSMYFRNSERRLKNKPEVKIYDLRRKAKVKINIEITVPGSFIEWEFESEAHDIGFGLFFKSSNTGTDGIKELIPVQNVDAHIQCETGTFLCEESGLYILVLDNTGSWFRSKQIFFRSTVHIPQKRMNNES